MSIIIGKAKITGAVKGMVIHGDQHVSIGALEISDCQTAIESFSTNALLIRQFFSSNNIPPETQLQILEILRSDRQKSEKSSLIKNIISKVNALINIDNILSSFGLLG